MNTSLKGTLVVGALTLALTVVLASCGGGGSGGSSGGGGKYGAASSAATTTAKGASSKSPSSKRASGGVLKTIVIKETEFHLSPSKVTLNKPGTYAFKAENKGSAEHNLEIDGEGVKGKGGQTGEARLEQNLQPGQSGVLTVIFKEPGTYEMYCPIIGHRLAGMKGSVVVR
jgi:uncharacterized cupredoxin-like copper-binding protein